MKRIPVNLLKTAALALLALSVSFSCGRKGGGSPAARKLALVQFNDSPLSELSRQGIETGLSMIGLVEGKDYVLTVSNAQGDISTLNMIMDGIVNQKPDLLFLTSTPTLQAAQRKIRDLPVVFTVVADPVLAGAGASFEEHQPNITGISTLGDYKRMAEVVRLVMPQVRSVGTLYSPGEDNSVKNLGEFKLYAAEQGIEVVAVPVNSATEVADATLAMTSRGVELVCQIIDNLTASSYPSISRICREKGIPVFGFVSNQIDMGAVLVISRDYVQAGIDAVNLAARIFGGEEVASIPFEFVSKTNIILNPAAAAQYGIVFPEALRAMENVVVKE